MALFFLSRSLRVGSHDCDSPRCDVSWNKKAQERGDYDDVILCKELKTQPRHYCCYTPSLQDYQEILWQVDRGSYIP